MADASTSWSWEEFNCPICLDLLKNPVAIPCGHIYSCPQCRQTFTPRPVLGKNTMLAKVVEKLKKTKLQAARPAQCYAGSGNVECDICTGDKNKAIKSCLVCLESYCQNHLERHEEFHSGKRHKMTDATGQLRDMICPLHDKLLEIFCRTDQQCICYLCMLDEHKNHETVSATAERTEKQRQLGEMQRKYQEIIQKREKELEELKEAVESHKRSAQAAVEDSERIFTELIRSIERRRSEVTQLIRDQEKAEVSRAEGQLEQLEQEIEDLRRRDAELEQLSHTDNHICFFQSFQSLSVTPGSTDSPSITVSSRLSFDDVGKSLSLLREKLENFCREEIEKISLTYIVVIPTSEPKTREDFLQYSHQLTLDLNTVNKNLCLSEENRVIEYTRKEQPYPDHPDRFDGFPQVLCRESVCGRCYWEVEWSGSVYISCEFGCNDQSWSLYCSDSSCSFWHNNGKTALPVVYSSSRIEGYMDHRAGTQSFYSVSDTMTLIHRVHTTFIHPLYAGFEFRSLSCGTAEVLWRPRML
uniref:B box-type domain-containing protein n=1 Tax=Cyprinus carpio TaxID=7962 RepID=A0A8C2FBN9_CYPCA